MAPFPRCATQLRDGQPCLRTVADGSGFCACRVRGSLEPLIDEAGELRAPLALGEDIVLHLEAEEEERRLRSILEHSGAVVWTTDTSLRLSRCRGSRLRRRGFGPEEVVGCGLEGCFGIDDPGLRARAAYRRPLSGAAGTCEGVCGRSYLARTQALGDTAGPIAGGSESRST
jgi:PAS domain-containing protein